MKMGAEYIFVIWKIISFSSDLKHSKTTAQRRFRITPIAFFFCTNTHVCVVTQIKEVQPLVSLNLVFLNLRRWDARGQFDPEGADPVSQRGSREERLPRV